MEDTERTENTILNLLVIWATVACWIRGRYEPHAEVFREQSSKASFKGKVSEKAAETEKSFTEQFI